MSFSRDRGWLPGILLLAAALRLYGIGHGLPFVYNPDEANILARALSVARSLDPEYYLYPSFFFYLIFAVMGGLFVAGSLLGRYESLAAFEARFFEDPTDFYVAGRVLVVVLALATIVLLERLVSKHFGKTAGRASAFFTAVAYFHARDSHYLKHDVPAGFLVALFLWAMDRALERKTLSSYLLAGVVLGIAFATHYYLIFLAPAFVLCHFAYRGREAFSRLAAAAAASALTFFLLSPFVILRFPTALEHMRANRQVVVDRSLSAGAGLFPSLGLYVEFVIEQGLGYILAALVLFGFFLLARREPKSLAFWAPLPLMFLAFLSYTFFAGRYLNPVLPCLAAAAGVTVSAIGARFGTAAAAIVTLAAGMQPLYFTLQVDRLFASEDTRSLAREWALEELPAGSTVALQSYSSPLPQSKESFEESLKENEALSELDRKGKYAQLLRVAESEKKSFCLFFLGKGDEPNRIYVGYETLAEGLEPLRELGVETIVLRRPPIPPPPALAARFRAGGKGGNAPHDGLAFPGSAHDAVPRQRRLAAPSFPRPQGTAHRNMVSRRSLIVAGAVGAFAFAASSFRYPRGGAVLIDFERGYEGAFVSGFHPRERSEGKYFRWTDDASFVELHHLPAKGSIAVEARLRTIRPAGEALPSLAFTANGVTVHRAAALPGVVTYHFQFPSTSSRLRLGIESDTFEAAGGRKLGVQVLGVRLKLPEELPSFEGPALSLSLAALFSSARGSPPAFPFPSRSRRRSC